MMDEFWHRLPDGWGRGVKVDDAAYPPTRTLFFYHAASGRSQWTEPAVEELDGGNAAAGEEQADEEEVQQEEAEVKEQEEEADEDEQQEEEAEEDDKEEEKQEQG